MRKLYFLAACLEAKISIVETEGLNFVRKIEDITIVERHVVSVTSEYNEMPLEHNTRVAVSCSRPLSLHVEDLSLLVFTHCR